MRVDSRAKDFELVTFVGGGVLKVIGERVHIAGCVLVCCSLFFVGMGMVPLHKCVDRRHVAIAFAWFGQFFDNFV